MASETESRIDAHCDNFNAELEPVSRKFESTHSRYFGIKESIALLSLVGQRINQADIPDGEGQSKKETKEVSIKAFLRSHT